MTKSKKWPGCWGLDSCAVIWQWFIWPGKWSSRQSAVIFTLEQIVMYSAFRKIVYCTPLLYFCPNYDLMNHLYFWFHKLAEVMYSAFTKFVFFTLLFYFSPKPELKHPTKFYCMISVMEFLLTIGLLHDEKTRWWVMVDPMLMIVLIYNLFWLPWLV